MRAFFRILMSFFLIALLSRFSHTVVAEDRFTECDACGYCRNRPAPENWNDCAVCLYSGSGVINTTQATENLTLKIDQSPGSSNLNKPPAPALGKYFTQLGCINTGVDSFRDPSSAGGVLNFLLTNLIFPTVGTLAFGTIIYGGFLLATAQGEQMKILQGRRLVTSAVVGLVFTLSSVLIINTVGEDILRIPGMGGGTKLSFVGWGTATTVNGVETYPNLSVLYDGNEIGTIESLKGSQSAPETREVYLPRKINLSNNTDIQRVKIVFTNDHCLSRDIPGACCLATPPDQDCTNSSNIGDRNVANIRILFDNKECRVRKSVAVQTNTNSDGSRMWIYRVNEFYVCDALTL